jgi:hypothetical protein
MVAAYNSPEAEPLRAHLAPPGGQATLQQLADTNTASDAEVAAFLAVHPKVQACRSTVLDQVGHTTPTIAAILAGEYVRADEILVALIQKRISWGNYITQGRELQAETRMQLNAEFGRIQAGLEQSHQAELARRQAAADAMARYYQTQQIINNMNQPVITNCVGGPGMVNCVSQ